MATIKIYSTDEETDLLEKFLDNNKKEMSSNWLTNISLGIITFALIFTVMVIILGLTLLSTIITIIAWFILIGSSIEKYSLTVPALQLWIATDYLRKDPKRKLVPYRTGFHLSKLWQSVDEANKIDLKKQVTVTSLNGWGCTSKDGVFFKTEFNLSHCPAEEFGVQYITWPEAVREITLRTAIEEVLSTLYAQRNANKIMEGQADIKKDAALIFGGNDKLSELEQTLGIRVKGPTISAIRMDEETQKAKSSQFKVKSLAESIKTLVAGGLSPEQAAKIAPVVMEFVTRTETVVTYDIKGLNNAQSVWIGGGMGGMGGMGSPIIGNTNKSGSKNSKKGGNP
jgi:hypothetical protein